MLACAFHPSPAAAAGRRLRVRYRSDSPATRFLAFPRATDFAIRMRTRLIYVMSRRYLMR